MIISDENSYPILLDSIDTPLKTEFFWILDLANKDFKLNPLQMNEELHTPALVLNILDYAVEVPANWNLLIYSEETSQLDVAEISDLTRGNFTAMVYNHKLDRIVPGHVKVVNYISHTKIHTPSLHKTHMLCHALGPEFWICLSPTDSYNKYLKNAITGDILP